EDARDVGLHGRLGDVLAARDLRVRHAPRGEQEHLPLARGEGGELRGLLGDAAARIEVLEQLPGGRGGDDGRARVHRADRREQELRVGVLQEETARAGAMARAAASSRSKVVSTTTRVPR